MDIAWTPQLDVGNEKLNAEHKMLIKMMHQLHELNAKTFDKEKVVDTFSEFIEFVEIHFEDEEAHMKSMHYPRLESHRKIHEELIASLFKQREELARSPVGRLPSSVFDFFNTWILTHILIADKDYAAYEQSHRSKSP